MRFDTDQMSQIKSNCHHGQYPERGKQNFAETSRQSHSEGHSIVLNEMKNSPIAQERDLLIQGHVGFNQNLQDLVGHKNQQDNQYGFPGDGHKFFCRILMNYCLDFASILSVAWGTARRRSLEISLPVSLQIP